MRAPSTPRGRAVVDRLVAAAATEFHRRGLRGASLDDILATAGAGRGQFYRYFDSRDDLVPIVLERQVDAWVARHAAHLGGLSSLEGVERFADALVELFASARRPRWCPIGALADDVLHDPTSRHGPAAAAAFRRMASYLTTGLTAMQAAGRLAPQADPEALALTFLACFEGGLLLAIAVGDVRPLRGALDAALAALRNAAITPTGDAPTP
ncbi:MAG: TetR/AcrR family transcriptional regulator [Acidimicrobiales bacterium]